MDQELYRLKRTLQDETCPQRVLQNVRREITRQRGRGAIRTDFLKLALFAGAAGSLVLAIFLWTPRPVAPLPVTPTTVSATEYYRVAEETKMSLACIGYALLEAGNSTETIIKEQIRNSLEKLKQSLAKQI